MFEKIMLLGALCTGMVQADFSDWKVDAGSKLGNTVLSVAAVSAGSYAMCKIAFLAVDKLESDGKISSANAARLRNILKVKMPILPLYVLYYNIMNPTKMVEVFKIFEKFFGLFSYGARLVGPEYTIIMEIIQLLSSRR